jgi:hypothetical protein
MAAENGEIDAFTGADDRRPQLKGISGFDSNRRR